MADERFHVVFEGRLRDGADEKQVKANLAKLFKVDPAKIETFFSGKRVAIKKNVDEKTAKNYQAALAKCGAVAGLIKASGDPKTPPQEAPTPQEARSAPQRPAPEKVPSPAQAALLQKESDAPTRSAIAEAARVPPPAAARGTPTVPDDMTMADVGAILVETSRAKPPNINTDHLDLAEVGVDLVKTKKVAAPEYDLSGLQLDPPGTTLVEPKATPRAEFDTAGLSMSEP